MVVVAAGAPSSSRQIRTLSRLSHATQRACGCVFVLAAIHCCSWVGIYGDQQTVPVPDSCRMPMYSTLGKPSRRNAYDNRVNDDVTLTDLHLHHFVRQR
jgi:hypothetical protein